MMDVSPGKLLERAKERFELHDYYACIHLVDELIEGGRAFADAYHLRGLAYHMVGQQERALSGFDEALALNSRYVEAHIHRGIVLAELGRGEDAAEAFAAARVSSGDSRGGVPGHLAAKLANEHAALGEAYAEAGVLGPAIEQYQSALLLGPRFHDLRYRLGRLLLEAGRSLEAREELEIVMQACPNHAEARGAFGLACYLSGDAGTARATWEAMARERPGDVRARAFLAMLDRGAPRD